MAPLLLSRSRYANLSPLMDVLFGTYECPDQEPEALGLREQLPTGYAAMLILPLVPSPRRPGV